MSQPTVSRCETRPPCVTSSLGRAIVDLYCASYTTPPATVVLDITHVDVVHGHQQLSLFNAHFDERCFFRSTSTTPPPVVRWP